MSHELLELSVLKEMDWKGRGTLTVGNKSNSVLCSELHIRFDFPKHARDFDSEQVVYQTLLRINGNFLE